MNNIMDMKTLIDNIDKYIIIDLRSPVEFEAGTIKNAVNIPLLDNENRKIIGTLYKENQKEAYRQGLKIGMEKLPSIYDEVSILKEDNPDKEIVFFCFRGGTRSKSVQAMMELLKVSSYKLDGGYKAYRTYILDNLPVYLKRVNWIVLTGNTGTGKTLILRDLIKQDYPVIDLEKYANNRGSIFGTIGIGNEVNQRIFDSSLFFQIKEYLDKNITNIFVECESKKIGNITLPIEMYSKMQLSSHILINVSIDKRVKIIADDYCSSDIDNDLIKQLIIGNEYFKIILGKKWVTQMLENIDNENYLEFIKRMLLDYYDKMYLQSQSKYTYDLIISNDDEIEIIESLKEYYNNFNK